MTRAKRRHPRSRNESVGRKPASGPRTLAIATMVAAAMLLGGHGASAQDQGSAPAPVAAPVAAPSPAPTAPKLAAGEAVAPTELPADLSVQAMVGNADPIVKGVMGLLLSASVATWSIGLFKFVELTTLRSRAGADLRAVSQSGTLAQVSKTLKKSAVARLVRSAELEMEASEHLPPEGIKERVALALQRTENAAARRVSAGTGILASVGSTGPFVGLFGTVWGIMNSFIHISNAHTTNLSVVAPGIAEALLATAMGLVAAIPAVLIYNAFSRAIAAYRALLGDASSAILRHTSRDLDRAERTGYHMAAE